jgi:hypothetical protein
MGERESARAREIGVRDKETRRGARWLTARKVGARLLEVLKVGRREDEHLACAEVAVEFAALVRHDHSGPALEVHQLLLGLLREEAEAHAHRQTAFAIEHLDGLVVVREVLEAAAGVEHAGEPKAVELALVRQR